MPKIELHATALDRILGDASLFASKDDTLPSINGVRLELKNRRLVAVATDRFILGASSAPLEVDPDLEWSGFIPLEEIPLIRKLCRPGRRQTGGWMSLRLSDKRVLFRTESTFSRGARLLSVPLAGFTFPGWRMLFRDEALDPDQGAYCWSVDPSKLAVFGQVSRFQHSRMEVRTISPTKQITVTIGPDFVGLIMPVRNPDENAYDRPAWV